MNKDDRLATVVRADPGYFVVRDESGELHYLSYRQVRPHTPREAGAAVRLRWSTGSTWHLMVAGPVD